jgi:hypothetical protein
MLTIFCLIDEIGVRNFEDLKMSRMQFLSNLPVLRCCGWIPMNVLVQSIEIDADLRVLVIIAGEKTVRRGRTQGTSQSNFVLPTRLSKPGGLDELS